HELAIVVPLPLDLDREDFLDLALVVGDEFLGGREIDARISAELRGGFFLAVVETIDLRPLGPGIISSALQRRTREDFQLDEAFAAVAHRGADAVGASVAAADDHDVLALGGNEIAVLVAVQQAAGVGGEELHREMNAFEVSA